MSLPRPSPNCEDSRREFYASSTVRVATAAPGTAASSTSESSSLRDTTCGFIRSVMWVPLVVRGQIIGNLSITSPMPHAYGPREATLALAVARQAAVAIENAKLYARIQSSLIEITAIKELMDDPVRATHLGANGRARVVAEFSWRRVAEDYLALLCR